MNYNHWLSGAGGRSDCPMNGKEMGQKRGHEHLGDQISAQEAVARRRLAPDSFTARSFPAQPHMASLSPLFAPQHPDHLPQLNPPKNMMCPVPPNGQNSELGAAELPVLNHSARFSRYARFAEMDSGNASSETNRLLDSIFTKAMYPRNSDKGAENMRQALSKDFNRSPSNSSSKFTLMGEQVEKPPLPPPPQFAANPQPLFPVTSYLYEPGDYNLPSFSSDTYPNSASSRAFYQSSLTDQSGNLNSSILFSETIIDSARASVGLKMGRHTDSGTMLSFEAGNADAVKSPAEPGTSKEGSKPGSIRRKEKHSSNIFPANVKSLLSTGIFDGVPIKYVSWDRSKNVRGTIQGTGYLCWCDDCNKTKSKNPQMVNAYQLEQHAGSKSKHPNDHIYFSNGKSIYGVVQELKNTPSDELLELIPAVTGSGINHANFSKWKESFQAASRELQRIFGSRAVDDPSC